MMRTYRGVVCEKKNKYMVFLTEQGEFLRGVPIGPPPEIGEEADFSLVNSTILTGRKVKPRFVGAIVAAATLLFFMVLLVNPLNEKVMAYVQLNAGDDVEFGVDRKGNVISLRYLNESKNEPEYLSDLKGYPILDVLNKAIIAFPVSDEKINITTVYPTSESERAANQMVTSAVQEVRERHNELNVNITEGTPEERKAANKKKMSIHKFKSTENEKKPAHMKDSPKKKTGQEQKDNSQKMRKETIPPKTHQQKGMGKEKGHSHKSEDPQNPPMEKSNNKLNKEKVEKVPTHVDQKGPPPHSSSTNKQNKHNQGAPVKKQQENLSKENNKNEHSNK